MGYELLLVPLIVLAALYLTLWIGNKIVARKGRK